MLDDQFCGKRQYQRLHLHSKCTRQLVCTIRVLCHCLNFPITWGINRKGKVITKTICNNHQNWILLFFVHHSLPTPFERLKKALRASKQYSNHTVSLWPTLWPSKFYSSYEGRDEKQRPFKVLTVCYFHLRFAFLVTKFIQSKSLEKQPWNFFKTSYTESIIEK